MHPVGWLGQEIGYGIILIHGTDGESGVTLGAGAPVGGAAPGLPELVRRFAGPAQMLAAFDRLRRRHSPTPAGSYTIRTGLAEANARSLKEQL